MQRERVREKERRLTRLGADALFGVGSTRLIEEDTIAKTERKRNFFVFFLLFYFLCSFLFRLLRVASSERATTTYDPTAYIDASESPYAKIW